MRVTLVKWAISLAVIGAAGGYAYMVGSDLSQRRVAELEDEVKTLNDELSGLRDAAAKQDAAMDAERKRADQWKARYDTEVPSEAQKQWLARVQARLDAGVTPARLAFFIDSAKNPSPCDEAPVTKRFIAQTPLFSGTNDSVSFGDGVVTVTAVGESALDSAGNPQAWVDTAKPMTARFTRLGGEATEVAGKLPLHHAVLTEDREYRFTLVPGPQGFVKVTGQACAKE